MWYHMGSHLLVHSDIATTFRSMFDFLAVIIILFRSGGKLYFPLRAGLYDWMNMLMVRPFSIDFAMQFSINMSVIKAHVGQSLER